MNSPAQRPKILCMFSGGLDSFGCAWELLTDPQYADYGIHLHHIHLINREQRTKQEKIATARFLEYCKSQKIDFSFSENILGFGFMQQGNFPMDSYVYAFLAGMICNNDHSIANVAVGRTQTDVENGIEQMRHIVRSQEIFNASLGDLKRFKINYIFPAKHLTQREIYDNLPKTLQQSFWSCRTPDGSGPCGQCETCKTLSDLNIEHPVLEDE